MEREKIYNALFKCNSKNEQKFSNFSQLNHIGKRIVYIVINLAIGLAERSANSLEAKIKTYWYINKHMARNSSFAENSTDCLKVLNILSLQSIRKFNPTEKVEKVKDKYKSNARSK